MYLGDAILAIFVHLGEGLDNAKIVVLGHYRKFLYYRSEYIAP